MELYIKTHCITLVFCYGTFKWGSFFKPSCLAIKRVKSASEAAKNSHEDSDVFSLFSAIWLILFCVWAPLTLPCLYYAHQTGPPTGLRASLPLRAGCLPLPSELPAYWAEADVLAPSEGKQMNCEGWTLMPFGWEITSFISSLYLWDFYVLNDFVHFVVILVLRRERECSCHGKLIDTRRSPSSFFAYSIPCLWGDASPPFWGEGQSWYFVSSHKTKWKVFSRGRQVELSARPASLGASRKESSGTNISKLGSVLDSSKTG